MIKKNKFLILRRVVQLSLIVLFVLSNKFGYDILKGNLSTSVLFGTIHLSDPYVVLQMVFAGAVISMDLLIGAITVFAFYALFAGRAFCSYVCPINLIADFASYMRRVFKLDKTNNNVLDKNIRFYLLGISFVVSFLTSLVAFELISPISAISRGLYLGTSSGIFAALCIFLFDLFIQKNGWCGHLCPLGAFFAATSKYSTLKVKHNVDKCIKCNKCKKICPENQVLDIIGLSSGDIKNPQCIKCARCIDVCPTDALNFGIKNYITKNK